MTPGGPAGVQVNPTAVGRTQSAGTLTQPVSCLSIQQPRAEHLFQRGGHAPAALPAPTTAIRPTGSEIERLVADHQPAAVDVDLIGDESLGQYGVDAGPPDALGVGT